MGHCYPESDLKKKRETYNNVYFIYFLIIAFRFGKGGKLHAYNNVD